MYVIQCKGFANGAPCNHEDQYVKTFDHDGADGRGVGVFTEDINKALKFSSFEEATEFWRKQSTVLPFRGDGKANRPLTAMNAGINKVPE